MKKSIIAAGLATVLAATSFAGSAMAGGPGPYYWYGNGPNYWSGSHHWYMYHPRPVYGYYHYSHRPNYYPYYPGYYGYSYDPGPAIVAGAIFGMIGAALAHQGHYRHHR